MGKSDDSIPAEIEKLSFEDAMKRLEAIVQKLESGDVGLEQSIEIYTEGTHLKRHCEQKLKAAEARIEKIRLSAEGEPEGTEPLDGD